MQIGTFLWELHSHQDRVLHNASRLGKLYEVNSVVDLNNDTILDLAAAVTTDSGMMYLMAISGRSGELLWQRELNASCVERPGNVVLYVTLDPSCFVLQGKQHCKPLFLAPAFFPPFVCHSRAFYSTH